MISLKTYKVKMSSRDNIFTKETTKIMVTNKFILPNLICSLLANWLKADILTEIQIVSLWVEVRKVHTVRMQAVGIERDTFRTERRSVPDLEGQRISNRGEPRSK